MNLNEKKPMVVGVCVLAIIASILSLFITQCPKSSSIDVSRYVAASEGLAKRIGERYPSGTTMVFVTMDPEINSPVFSAQLEGFEEGFAPYKENINEVGRIYVKLSDLERGTGSGMPVKIYQEAVEKYPNANIIVSLVGIPVLSDEQIDELPLDIPMLEAVILYGVGIRRAFEEGLVSGAVLPRYEQADNGGKEPDSADALFDKYYQYLTEENYDQLTF